KNGTVAQWREANDLTAAKYDAAFAGVENMTPPDAVAQAVWDQCQHGTNYFFPWHRLYLHYFEQVLQQAANDPTLRLPYWDYTNPAQLAMPAEFTIPTYTNAQGQVVSNPLYEPRRALGWNAPGTKTLNSVDTNIDQALDNPVLLNTTVRGKTVNGYQRTIELSPHGYVHCTVIGCRATVMGAVPYSANDPIFYVHHANVDRLWDCWTSIAGHVNPGGSWLTQQFSYVDASGKQVTNQVGDLFKPGFIDYVYEQPSNCARAAARTVPAAATAAPRAGTVRSARAALARPASIGLRTDDLSVSAPVVRHRLTLPATASLAHPRQFALGDPRELAVATELTLRGVRFERHPNAEFRVFLERADNPAVREFVGTLTFFSQEPTGSAHAHHHGTTENSFRFDVTDALRALRVEGTGTLELNVVVEVEDDDREDFDPQRARLVVDEMELHVRRDQ
ncbi:MAG TPA: tyrosinase family protein, partial [Thermoanaerobaculia bacterium]